jgi:hypothetical protein
MTTGTFVPGGAGKSVARPFPLASRLSPEWCFWIVGIAAYGLFAIAFAEGGYLDQPSRDIWQHLAALRELIAHPLHPGNPFVATTEASRHYNAYWVAVAAFSRLFGWNAWQALAFGGFVCAAVLLAGIRAFADAFYKERWGRVALLAAMLLSWSFPVSHTGYHSPLTLIEGFGYPACLLIGLSLILGALIIRVLEGSRSPLLVCPLVAFMLATHQLGAVIGLAFAGCLVLLWPAQLRPRLEAAVALAAGVAAALCWPYYSPLAAVARVGNPTWSNGVDFYIPSQLVAAFIPSAAGVAGLLHRDFRRRSWPILAALALYLAGFVLGRFGVLIATRLIMPAVLMMHIGLGALLLRLIPAWPRLGRPVQLSIFTAASLVLAFNALGSVTTITGLRADYKETGDISAASQRITADLPPSEPVAAYDVAAWPIVATGRRVGSVPWPEPMIGDLLERQAVTTRLFDPRLNPRQRRALAGRLGVKVLIVDKRGKLEERMGPGALLKLEADAAKVRSDGPLVRLDLF